MKWRKPKKINLELVHKDDHDRELVAMGLKDQVIYYKFFKIREHCN